MQHPCQAAAEFIFTMYASKQTVIRGISPADSGSDLRYWMTRGNHIEPRYDQIQGRPLMACTKTQLHHVVTHSTAYPFIAAAHIPFKRQHNPVTSILLLTIYGSVTVCVRFIF